MRRPVARTTVHMFWPHPAPNGTVDALVIAQRSHARSASVTRRVRHAALTLQAVPVTHALSHGPSLSRWVVAAQSCRKF